MVRRCSSLYKKPMSKRPQAIAHTPNEQGDSHYLDDHLRAVGKLAGILASKFSAEKLGYYAGLWHDLGKYNPKFQEYLQLCHAGSDCAKRVPHAIYGAILSDEVCDHTNIAPLIYGHHAGLPNYSELDSILGEFLENPTKETIYQQVIDLASQEIEIDPDQNLETCLEHLPENDPLAREVLDRLLFSCLIDADRLDTEEFDNPEQAAIRSIEHPELDQLWQIFDQKQKKFIDKKKTDDADSHVFQVRQEVYANCLQEALREPGIFRLTVPTGGGKTLSGLAFALKHGTHHNQATHYNQAKFERIIVAVPYTSIIEQTVKVYRNIFSEEFGESAILEHHSAIKSDLQIQTNKAKQTDLQEELDEGARRTQRQARLATQNWDAPLIVTTTVQLFESLFAHRPSKCRKLHNIIGSVIILDEVQTLPIALRVPICSMLEELVKRYRVSIVLCTATQPVLEGNDGYFQGFDPNSIRDIILPAKAKDHFKRLQRVNYDLSSIQTGTKWSWIDLVSKLNDHQQALAILNTRKDALKVIEALQVKQPDTLDAFWIEEKVNLTLQHCSILHLSTLLCGAHRQAVLDEVRDRLNPKHPKYDKRCILISTQVIEAGVNLDFPAVYRALGPFDRIVQAAGRCNREGNLKADGVKILGQMTVFELEKGSIPKKNSEYDKMTEKHVFCSSKSRPTICTNPAYLKPMGAVFTRSKNQINTTFKMIAPIKLTARSLRNSN
jgi:CRISPR-associated endonuclease/helicase Cas3